MYNIRKTILIINTFRNKSISVGYRIAIMVSKECLLWLLGGIFTDGCGKKGKGRFL
jgi:hypothetical protein